MLINLDANTKNKIDWLIKYIYLTVRIKYAYTVSDNNTITKYYNSENMWSIDPQDRSESCGGYWDCELKFDNTNDDIFYEFIYNPQSYKDDLDENEYGQYTMNESGINCLLYNSLDNIYLKSTKKIIIHNESGFNGDHRGSDHTKICLNFEPNVTLEPVDNKIAFKDFVKACFDIKSHKFDFWYELYCGVKNMNETDDSYIISVCFDHGS
ncbi:hypothetical protein QJ857_gp0146 [Tupanvirus soda lake]|uniref:Uncharacterized protein n=2 Tax=Tupanvirus TaxID=2094720 RepID=A0A6N1NXD0_9VIRU|nr:hypothetical protein QJ857_gp0146 [Tupanvirus soda lake]QKU35878.1 hypothetical protein [Tupanvirus soda lake]